MTHKAVNMRDEIIKAAAQVCRDCGEPFPYDPVADRCPECVAEALGDEPVVRDPESWQAVAREGRRFA